MSQELHVFMQDSRIPSRDAWQLAMERLGFTATLDAPFDLRSDSGFRPATFKGQSTGFEFYLETAADVLSNYPHIASTVGDRDKCATFRWGGDLNECAAGLSAAAALVNLADGIYYYPDDGILYDAEQVVEATRKDLDELL